jgi:hypothetical protein
LSAKVLDFIVRENGEPFGLEVTKVYIGGVDGGGSGDRRDESKRHRAIDKLRREYEATRPGALRVEFVGDISRENMDQVIDALLSIPEADIPSRGRKLVEIEIELGPPPLKIYIRHDRTPNWFYVNDSVGWVDEHPEGKIAHLIKVKSMKLPAYKASSGLNDIRLLIVANRLKNSGKLALKANSSVDHQGFRNIFFLSYPEEAWTLDPS